MVSYFWQQTKKKWPSMGLKGSTSQDYSIKVQLYQELPSPRIWPYKYFLPLT